MQTELLVTFIVLKSPSFSVGMNKDSLTIGYPEKMDSTMKIFFLQFLIWISTTIHTTQGECIGCASGVAFSGSCYSFELDAANFSVAESTCSSRRQHLIYIESNNEQAYIQQRVSENFPGMDFWIGLTKDNSENIIWLDQSELVYTKWITMSMSSFDDGADCFRLRQERDYKWHDKQCDSVFGYICEGEIGTSGSCGTGMVSFGKSCYRINSATMNFKEAYYECELSGAHLVFIDTREEQTFLKSQIPLVDNQADFWIGLQKTTTGVAWTDGTVPAYNNFEYDSFNEGTPCFRMKSGQDYYWHDRPCSFLFPFICEQEDACSTSIDGAPTTTTQEDQSSTESEETTEPATTNNQYMLTPTIKPQSGELRSSYGRVMAEDLSLPDSAVFATFRVNSIIRCAVLCNELTDCTHFTHTITSSTCMLGNARNLQPAELMHLDGARSFSVSSSKP